MSIKIYLNVFTKRRVCLLALASKLNNPLPYIIVLGIDIITIYDAILNAAYNFNLLGQ